ncbi:50s ribosomal protein l9 [Bordetella pertussis]|nr:50s ribosomal protein l9 [Bordetella pertussis]
MPNGQIKAVGEYLVQAVLHADVVADVVVLVEGEMA